MDMDSYLADFCIKLEYLPHLYDREGFFTYGIPLWIAGVLSNLVNVAVFRHKNMAHPINSIFLWLSISDLLELAVLASYQWAYGWRGWMQILNYIDWFGNHTHIHQCVVILISQYLIQVFHTITIGLNIVLVFCQYMVVAHPLINQKNPFNKQFIKYAIIWTYILSFVLYLPFWYIQKIELQEYSELNLINCKIQWRRNQDGNYWPMNPLLHTCILICGVVLRIVPLVILIILCALLIFAINNAHRKRRGLGMEARQLSKAQRKVNRMNVTITIVISMFLITEVPIAISSLLEASERFFFFCGYAIDFYCLLLGMLFNCSYSIFCYLLRIKEYRETLKLLLNERNLISCRASVVEQTYLEVHPLQGISWYEYYAYL